MTPLILTSIVGIIQSVVEKMTSNSTLESPLDKFNEMVKNGEINAMIAQSELNKMQASSPSLFVSGVRPFIMWVLGLSIAWQFLVAPVLFSFFSLLHINFIVQSLDISNIFAILTGMLGLGGLRTYEKQKGVARDSL